MRVRMTRTVSNDPQHAASFLVGEEYTLDDRLAEAWIMFGVCDPVADSQEAAVAADMGEGSPEDGSDVESRDAADHDALTGDEG